MKIRLQLLRHNSVVRMTSAYAKQLLYEGNFAHCTAHMNKVGGEVKHEVNYLWILLRRCMNFIPEFFFH